MRINPTGIACDTGVSGQRHGRVGHHTGVPIRAHGRVKRNRIVIKYGIDVISCLMGLNN